MMKFNEYQNETKRTCPNDNPINFILGICGEAGEIADLAKKVEFQGHPFTDDTLKNIILECGDLLWYIARLSQYYGFSLENVAKENIKKLKKRYPNGFEIEKSVNRGE